ncbi:MAG: ATP-binding protein, partial [Actinobacteria bacterium]|nr:ATP-binding protein [Actinomycetota bacterium]
MAGPFTAIEAVLGSRLAEVDEQSIARLVSNRVREASSLDFKEGLYGRNDSEKRDLAADISAMANAAGGVILLGVRDEDGAAVELTPVELSEEEEQRIRLVVASNVAPSPDFAVHRVEATPASGFYLLAIPPSPWKPHAAIVNKALRYPRRFGPDTVYLSESEVADAYRNRFQLAEEQIERTRLIRAEALPFVELRDEAWLGISVVPNAPGHLALSARTPRELMEWVVTHRTPRLGMTSTVGASFTYGSRRRRVTLSRTPDPQTGRARYGYYEFHTDGAAVGLVPIASNADNGGYRVYDEHLVEEVVALVQLLADFAVEKAHCVGEAALTAEIIEANRGKHPPSHSLRL